MRCSSGVSVTLWYCEYIFVKIDLILLSAMAMAQFRVTWLACVRWRDSPPRVRPEEILDWEVTVQTIILECGSVRLVPFTPTDILESRTQNPALAVSSHTESLFEVKSCRFHHLEAKAYENKFSTLLISFIGFPRFSKNSRYT